LTTPKDAKQSRRTAPDDEPDFIPLEDRVAATDIGRAIVLHPWIKSGGAGAHLRPGQRAPEDRLEEAVGLAAAIHLDIAHSAVVPVASPKPGTLFGEGKVEEIKGLVKLEEAGLVIIDGPVTPIQQRNLERAWKTKVLDRTGLILEIFGERAATREGALQVELAHLIYQKSRLVRSWTHLERQRAASALSAAPAKPRSRLTAATSRTASPSWKTSSSASPAPASCTARSAAACLIPSSRSSATPMPASPPCSTA